MQRSLQFVALLQDIVFALCLWYTVFTLGTPLLLAVAVVWTVREITRYARTRSET